MTWILASDWLPGLSVLEGDEHLHRPVVPDPVLPPDVSLELGLEHQGLAEQAAQGDVVRLQISIISILIVAGSCPFIRISQFFVTFVTKKI